MRKRVVAVGHVIVYTHVVYNSNRTDTSFLMQQFSLCTNDAIIVLRYNYNNFTGTLQLNKFPVNFY